MGLAFWRALCWNVWGLRSSVDSRSGGMSGQMDEGKCGRKIQPRQADGKPVYPAGMKWTKQRKDVYEVLLSAEAPLSAVQIYQNILKKEAEVTYAVSTIYRILAAFEEAGFVEKSTFMGDGTVTYEWKKGGHTHYAICLGCHKKVALQACPFEHLHMDTDTGDFVVTGHKLELYGYCGDCEKNFLKK